MFFDIFRLNPTISFPWSEIKNLKFKDRKFIIKPTDKTTKDFVLFTASPRMSKYILNLGIGNHSLYVRRRKPDSAEVAKMKEKAEAVRKNKQLQRYLFYLYQINILVNGWLISKLTHRIW